MKRYEGELAGAALSSVMKVLEHSPTAIAKLLAPYGLTSIEPDRWYDLDIARNIFYDIERVVGARVLYNVGVQIMCQVEVPAFLTDPTKLFTVMDARYRTRVRGSHLGEIITAFEGERSVRITYATPFPCHLDQGLTAGAVRRFNEMPLVEHMPDGCRDKGASACTFRVSW